MRVGTSRLCGDERRHEPDYGGGPGGARGGAGGARGRGPARDRASGSRRRANGATLKENSEYHDAKNEQAHLETKIARLREKIADAVVVEETPDAASGVVGFGSTVVVRDQDGAEQTWRIVSSHDASPREGRLSAESPVAVALLGRAQGDQMSVTLPKGRRTLTVMSVS